MLMAGRYRIHLFTCEYEIIQTGFVWFCWVMYSGMCFWALVLAHPWYDMFFAFGTTFFFLLRLAPTQGRVCEEQKAKENRARLKDAANSNRGTKQLCTLQPKDRFLRCSSNALQKYFFEPHFKTLSEWHCFLHPPNNMYKKSTRCRSQAWGWRSQWFHSKINTASSCFVMQLQPPSDTTNRCKWKHNQIGVSEQSCTLQPRPIFAVFVERPA